MRYRPLGNTGITVSVIGFGCWGIGGLSIGATSYGATDDAESRRALRRAFELGITLFDTSDIYGYGHSEELIGQTLSDVRSQIVIASKVGFLEHLGPQDFSPAYLRTAVERSLRRLRTDYLDLYQLHGPAVAILTQQPETLRTLQALQQEGKIRAYGVSARSPADGVPFVDQRAVQTMQVNFNLVDQRTLEVGLFDRCAAQQVGMIVRTPLCFGFLSGRYAPETAFDPRDHRSAWSPEQIARWATATREFAAACRRDTTETDAQIALRFCCSYPAVAAAIPGMLTVAEVEENAAAGDLGPLAPEALAEIEAIYQGQTFFLGSYRGR